VTRGKRSRPLEEAKKRPKRRRKELPSLPDRTRPYWLPDDRFLLGFRIKERADVKREQRRIDAERITERVVEITACIRQMRYPRAAERAWQIVALELGRESTGDPDEEAAEGKHLARWVRRNR
jgi:hypothetical protein